MGQLACLPKDQQGRTLPGFEYQSNSLNLVIDLRARRTAARRATEQELCGNWLPDYPVRKFEVTMIFGWAVVLTSTSPQPPVNLKESPQVKEVAVALRRGP